MAPTKKDLEPVKDAKTVERYLRYALDFREQISCHLEPFRFDALLRKLDFANLTLELEVNKASYASLGYEQRARIEPPNELRLSFAVNDVLFFLHGRLAAAEAREISVTADLPMYKLQRRNAVRIKPLKSHGAGIEIEGINYILHDLSASGLSFMVMPAQKKEFLAGEVFRAARFQFSGLDVPVDIEVMGVTPLKEGQKHLLRVGLRFLTLSAAVEQHIAREAYLHNHKIWSRWI